MTRFPVTTSPVTSSRKLFIAALLLAGGYGAAFVFGPLAQSLLPATEVSSSPEAQPGWLSAVKGLVDRPEIPAITGELVPESQFASSPRQPNQPTWLTATSESNIPARVASQPAFAPSPSISNGRPIDNFAQAAPDASPSLLAPPAPEPQPPAPKARITNVVAASAASPSREASPWDRWPRWDASNEAAERGPVAATFQDSNVVATRTMQATFNASDIVRKNSPARDLGSNTESSSARTHVVVDGDSLARLAERYLDDAERDDEIYRLNRDVISSPELLPIGVELKIPDSRVADTAALPIASSYATAERTVPSGMVPVRWEPQAFEASPRAELLRPVPAGRND